MPKLPAFQFYPADWLNDIKLQACSISAQGLLINLMCLMHQSEKYGFLLINGEKSEKKSAKIVRLTPKKFSNLLEELIENGVLKKDENGVVYCERMVKDQALREIRRECGKLGGNPDLVKQKVKQTDNQNLTPSSSSSSSSSSSKQVPSGKSQKQQNCPYQKIIDLYNSTLPELPKLTTITEQIKKTIKARWKEQPDLSWWQWYFEGVKECPFLMGLKTDWQASFTWLIGPKNMAKVLSGEYLDKNKTKKNAGIDAFINGD